MENLAKKKSLSIVDIIIISVIIVVAIAGVVFINSFSTPGNIVVITVGNEEYKTVPLDSDKQQEIKINNTNTVIIENGEVYMKEADCPDKVCINTGKIKNVGEIIVCKPNNVKVEIKGDSGAEDAVW